MSRYRDLTNTRFGRLFVVELDRITEAPKQRVYWKCWCDCGVEKSIRGDGMTSGAVQSCGCLGKELRSAAASIATTTHGHTKGARGTPFQTEYRIWANMKSRCQNPNTPSYAYYGARGIRVCDRWNDFANFYADMGPRPVGLSIDRIDNDGDYEPSNCRWATAKEQRSNRRDSKKVGA